MKRHYLKVLLLAALAAQPLLAQADHDDDGRRWSGSNSLDWRLGDRGNDIYYRYPGERQWRRAPGSAHDVGDGWVIGTDRRNGGYGIYRWNGNDWQRMPGAAVEIGGSYQRPWVINDRGERYAWSGYEWREERNSRRWDEREYDEREYDDRDYDRGDRRDRRDNDRNRRNSWRDDRR